jgi:hypothetical protein
MLSWNRRRPLFLLRRNKRTFFCLRCSWIAFFAINVSDRLMRAVVVFVLWGLKRGFIALDYMMQAFVDNQKLAITTPCQRSSGALTAILSKLAPAHDKY